MKQEMKAIRYPTIGAFELKRTYQRNMLIAVMTVATLWALSVAVVGLATHAPDEVLAPPTVTIDYDFDITMTTPPSVVEEPTIDESSTDSPPPFTLPEATDNPAEATDFQLLNAAVYQRFAPPSATNGGKLGGYYFATPVDEIPAPQVFVATDKLPQPLELPAAHYPEMARKAGMEGTVQLQVYIDADGKVRKVVVAVPSGSEIGFEEAAVEAAWLGRWSPAEQNGKPVGLWVSYPVRFRLNQ